MAKLKSLMDCPQEVMSMILNDCTQETLHSLMRVNKRLLDFVSVAYYSSYHLTEKNLLSFLRSDLASRKAGMKGVCGTRWKEARMKLIKSVSMHLGRDVSGAGETDEPMRTYNARQTTFLINRLPPDTILPNVESFVTSIKPMPYLNETDMLKFGSRISAKYLCDRSLAQDIALPDECLGWAFDVDMMGSSTDAPAEPGPDVGVGICDSDEDDMDDAFQMWDMLYPRNRRTPEIVTIHQLDISSTLWRHPGKITRLCFSYCNLHTTTRAYVKEAVNHLADIITVVEEPCSLFHRFTPIQWEIYQNGFDDLGEAFGVADSPDDNIDYEVWADQQIQLAEIDATIARHLERELKQRCPMVKKRLKVFSFLETECSRCEGCGHSMNFDAKDLYTDEIKG